MDFQKYVVLIPYLFPIAVSLGIAVFAWRLFRYGLFDIVPIARDRVIENMRDGIIVIDHRNRVVDINRSAFALLPRGTSEVVGRKVQEIFPTLGSYLPQGPDGITDYPEAVLENKEETRHYEIQVSSLYDRLDLLSGRVVILRDITERKQAEEALRRAHDEMEKKIDERTLELKEINRALEREIAEHKQVQEALRESESRYRLLAENATDVIWTFSLEKMRFTYISPSVWTARGLTHQEAMELPLEKTISPQSAEKVMAILQEELAREGMERVTVNLFSFFL
jgi:PAS domain S-box-containing protein